MADPVRRAALARAFFVLSVLTCGGAAMAEFALRPPLTFRPDDQAVSFGNTAAAPDVSISWETTGDDDHLSCVVASGGGLLVSSDANVDRSGVLASGATYLGVCSDDAGSPTECLTASHNGTDGLISLPSGRLKLFPTGGVVDTLDTAGAVSFSLSGAVPTRTELWHVAVGETGYVLGIHQLLGQTTFALGASGTPGGHQLVLTTYDSRQLDHDHDADTDPVLYIHSVTSPDTDNTEWGSLGFEAATDEFQIMSAGDLRIPTTGPELFLGNAVNAADVRVSGGSSTQEARVGLYHGTTEWTVWHTKAGIVQSALLVADAAGNQVVVGNNAALGQNYDHGVATNPTLYVHSDTNPDTNNTQWGSLAHDQTDLVVSTGLGNVNLTPAGELLVVDPGTNSALSMGDVTEIQTTDATVTTCTSLTLASGQIVHLRAMVVGIVNSTGADQASYEIVGTHHNVGGGGATLVGAVTSVHLAESAGASAWAATFTTAGAVARVSVTGADATTINWACSLEYLDR